MKDALDNVMFGFTCALIMAALPMFLLFLLVDAIVGKEVALTAMDKAFKKMNSAYR